MPKAYTAAETLPPEVTASIMGIHWQDYVINDEVLERARLPSIEAMLLHHAGPAMSRALTTPGCPKLSSLANSAKACVTEVLHAGATRTS